MDAAEGPLQERKLFFNIEKAQKQKMKKLPNQKYIVAAVQTESGTCFDSFGFAYSIRALQRADDSQQQQLCLKVVAGENVLVCVFSVPHRAAF